MVVVFFVTLERPHVQDRKYFRKVEYLDLPFLCRIFALSSTSRAKKQTVCTGAEGLGMGWS